MCVFLSFFEVTDSLDHTHTHTHLVKHGWGLLEEVVEFDESCRVAAVAAAVNEQTPGESRDEFVSFRLTQLVLPQFSERQCVLCCERRATAVTPGGRLAGRQSRRCRRDKLCVQTDGDMDGWRQKQEAGRDMSQALGWALRVT